MPAELSLRPGLCRAADPWGSHTRCYFPPRAIYQNRFTAALLIARIKEKCGRSNFKGLFPDLSFGRDREATICALKYNHRSGPSFRAIWMKRTAALVE